MRLFLAVLLLVFFVQAKAKFSSMYNFGDSLVDFGNNNNNPATFAKGNFLPYGKDFPGGPNPTGRFANAYLVPDFIAAALNLPSVLPYFSPLRNPRQGVNFASAGCGLYNTTGNIFALGPSPLYPRPMAQQVRDFIQVKGELVATQGTQSTLKHLSKALFYLTFGSNDIANNYFLPNSSLQQQFTVDQFTDILVNIFDSQLQILYREGGRNFVVASLFPLGCSTLFLIQNNVDTPGDCYEPFNDAARSFNLKLKNRLSTLSRALPGSKFLYANSYDVPRDIVRNYQAYGFTVPNVGCCNFIGPNRNEDVPLCLPASPTCPNASLYVYWDQVHPTSRTYGIISSLFLSGKAPNIEPINVQQLNSLTSC